MAVNFIEMGSIVEEANPEMNLVLDIVNFKYLKEKHSWEIFRVVSVASKIGNH